MSPDTFLWLPATTWTALAAIAAAMSAIAAWRAVAASRKSADAQIIDRLRETKDKYDSQLIEAQNKEPKSDGVHPWDEVVSSWFDFVEFTAHLCNNKMLSRPARKFVDPMLIEWIRAIDSRKDVRDKLIANVSGPTTYEEIRRFLKKNKRALGDLSQKVEGKVKAASSG